jgi:hypothetical protein
MSYTAIELLKAVGRQFVLDPDSQCRDGVYAQSKDGKYGPNGVKESFNIEMIKTHELDPAKHRFCAVGVIHYLEQDELVKDRALQIWWDASLNNTSIIHANDYSSPAEFLIMLEKTIGKYERITR